MDRVLSVTSKVTRIPQKALVGRSRKGEIVLARHLCWLLASEQGHSDFDIGVRFGLRRRETVWAALRNTEFLIREDKRIYRIYSKLRKEFYGDNLPLQDILDHEKKLILRNILRIIRGLDPGLQESPYWKGYSRAIKEILKELHVRYPGVLPVMVAGEEEMLSLDNRSGPGKEVVNPFITTNTISLNT
jgi:hypothetical protein